MNYWRKSIETEIENHKVWLRALYEAINFHKSEITILENLLKNPPKLKVVKLEDRRGSLSAKTKKRK